ncbi:DMT family transporter [Pseudohalocynthiibacter aestuariivivens]|nr:DMT family transporter [Pseudohalocynthiibacter aestuariivivens]
MTGAIASFSLMAISGRAVSFELDTFEIMLFRSAVGLIVVLIVAGMAGTLNQVSRRHLGLHLQRNICHFAGQNLWFLAITLIPLAQVFALEFTAPLWALLMAPFVLGERLTRVRVLAAMTGFIGILIVARPAPDTISIGMLAGITAAVGFAGAAVLTRKLTRSESLTCILVYMTAMQSVLGIVCAGIDGDIALPSAGSVPWLILIALCGLVAHFCLTKALMIAPASVVMPFDFVRLPLIAVVGALIYGEVLDIYVFIGAVVIFGANYINILSEIRARRLRASAV